jgi:hypothetical protein
MISKHISGDCSNCESVFDLVFMEELVSEELPQYCPFCGELIEGFRDDTEEDEDENESEDENVKEDFFVRRW